MLRQKFGNFLLKSQVWYVINTCDGGPCCDGDRLSSDDGILHFYSPLLLLRPSYVSLPLPCSNFYRLLLNISSHHPSFLPSSHPKIFCHPFLVGTQTSPLGCSCSGQPAIFSEWNSNKKWQNQNLERVSPSLVCLPLLPILFHLLCFPPEHLVQMLSTIINKQ